MAASNRKRASNPPGVAPPLGPHYSNAVIAAPGPLLFVSGMVAWDEDRNVVGKGNIKAQTRQTLENLKAILAGHGATLDDVVKVTVFVTDLAKYAETGEVRREYFPNNGPASTTVQVAGLVQPDLEIEIDAVAIVEG